MILNKLDVTVLYEFIAVFDDDLKDPFNTWKDRHVTQGFSWRPSSVSFGVVDTIDPLPVIVSVGESLVCDEDTKIALSVPFYCFSGFISVGSVVQTERIELGVGFFQLRFLLKVLPECFKIFIDFSDRTAELFLLERVDETMDAISPLLLFTESA